MEQRLTYLCSALFCCLPAAGEAQFDPSYLNEMPPIERVLADVQGKNRLDTMARQSAAMPQLARVIEDMAGQRRWHQLTPDETRLRDTYSGEGFRIKEQALVGLRSTATGINSPRLDWLDAQGDYERDPRVRAELLNRYFSPTFLGQPGVKIADMDSRVAASQAQIREDFGIRPEFFESIDAEVLLGGAMLLLLLLDLIALFLFRETRTFGLSRSDPTQLCAGFKRRSLRWIRGTVTNYNGRWVYSTTSSQKYNETSGRWENSSSTSRTYVEQFELVEGESRQAIYVENSWIEIPEGNLASAVKWCLLALLTVCLLEPFTYLYGAAGIMHGWLAMPLIWFGSWYLLSRVGGWRAERFARRDCDRLLAAIKKSEA